MTARAHQIGMTRSNFQNPNGLPNKAQISTARDMAVLGRRLMLDFPEQFAYFAKTEFPFRGVMIKGHNHFMENYDGADGLKTGYTFASGFNLAASARHGDQRLITVMFGGASAKIRDDHVAALMDAGFAALQRDPAAVQVAQSVDSTFPTLPAAAMAPQGPAPVQTAGAEHGDDDAIGTMLEPRAAAGDAEEPNPLPSVATAAPLAETATLVPAPYSGNLTAKGQVAATKAATMRNKVAAAVPAPSPAPTASWGIQVGAFSNRLLAQNQANAVASKVSQTFEAATARVMPVKLKDSKMMFRAQVVGLSRKETAKACALAGKLAVSGCKSVAPDQKTVAMR
jgi:D-alanyl-D-alanine carboxypeptidase